MLKLSGLRKQFGSVAAVDGIDLAVPQGQMVGLIGRSGAGKSTLLRLINRLVEPSAGVMEHEGIDLGGLRGGRLRQWRARSAMIFQQFNLVSRLDVITNVLIGRVGFHGSLAAAAGWFSREERARAVLALDRLELAAHALQRADRLSGGQQQRVAIARALVQEPRLVLADEPIASLDPRNAARVMDALRTINREDGITVLCSLHDLDAATSHCDRIIGLAEGRIVFDAAPAALGADAIRRIFGIDDPRQLSDDEPIPMPRLPRRAVAV